MRAQVVLLALLGAVPAASAAPLERIAGSVRYLERTALPTDATLTVELFEVSPQNAQNARLARLALPTRGRQAPLAFELPFHPDDVRPDRRYALRATLINGGGELLFAGTQAAFAGDRPDLLLRPVRELVPSTPLENTYWKLVEVNGQPARMLPGEREAYLLLLAGQASGGSGCNKLMGGYALGDRGTLAVGPLASTRMACPPDMTAQEAALLDAYARTTAYRIDGESLALLNGDAVLARFVARHFR